MKTNAFATLALVATAACGVSTADAQMPIEAGKHYTVISPAQRTSTEAGKVEVTEVFMFGCPGCFSFEPHVQNWLATKADYINFVRIPAPWNPTAVLHARAFYTAQALGKLEEIDGPFFNEFHVNGNYLDTEAKIATFFEKYGVDKATFTSTFNSPGITTKIEQAKAMITRYRAASTPTVIVNGKYIATGQQAGSYENWFAIINELAAREYAAATAPAATNP